MQDDTWSNNNKGLGASGKEIWIACLYDNDLMKFVLGVPGNRFGFSDTARLEYGAVQEFFWVSVLFEQRFATPIRIR